VKPLALLTVLLVPGLGLAVQPVPAAPLWSRAFAIALARGAAVVVFALACASAQLIHTACWLVGLGRIHAAVAALCWLAPILAGVWLRRRRVKAS
jgi:hypothetical protein